MKNTDKKKFYKQLIIGIIITFLISFCLYYLQICSLKTRFFDDFSNTLKIMVGLSTVILGFLVNLVFAVLRKTDDLIKEVVINLNRLLYGEKYDFVSIGKESLENKLKSTSSRLKDRLFIKVRKNYRSLISYREYLREYMWYPLWHNFIYLGTTLLFIVINSSNLINNDISLFISGFIFVYFFQLIYQNITFISDYSQNFYHYKEKKS